MNPITMWLGAMLPDADHRGTKIGFFIPLWKVFPHRGFTHTVQFGLLMGGVCALCLWSWEAGVAYCVGQLTHMLLDSCTPSGLSWFGKKRKRAS